MEYDLFCQEMLREVAERQEVAQEQPERMRVEDGRLIAKYADSSIAPRIDLQEIYEKFKEGWEMPILADMLAQELEAMHQKVAGEELTVDAIKRHLRCAVVNRSRNEALLAHTPHEPMLDLAVVARYYIPDVGSFVFTEDVCQMLRMTGNEVLELAHKNTDRMDFSCREVTDIIREIMRSEGVPDKYVHEYLDGLRTDGRNQLYVLTTSSRIDGAAALTCRRALEQVHEQLGEDYYILPSSTDELMVVRKSGGWDPRELEDIVRDINMEQEPERSQMSDHVYVYNGITKRVSLAVAAEQEPEAETAERSRSEGRRH